MRTGAVHSDGSELPIGARADYQPTGRFAVDRRIVEYYSSAGMDYEPWSAAFNMHFGYFRAGLNPLRREQLLEEMNAQVYRRLDLPDGRCQVIDLGCGVGASARYGVAHASDVQVTAITIVPWQVEKATALTPSGDLDKRLCFRLADYRNTPYPDASFDAAYAIESSCYDKGLDKGDFLAEAHRILKPGGRLVVADGFRRARKGSALFEYCFKETCDGWSLETFALQEAFREAAEAIGFESVAFDNCSLRVVPSVMHVPWVSLKYWWTQVRGAGPSDGALLNVRKNHLKAPLLGILTGLHWWNYGYYLVTLEKPL